MIAICRGLDSPSLRALVCTSRFFRYLMECDATLTKMLSSSRMVRGVHVLLQGNISPYIPKNFFETLLSDLLRHYPQAPTTDPKVYVDGNPFKIQDLSPAVRRSETHRLYQYLTAVIEQAKLGPFPTKEKPPEEQSYYFPF